MKKYTKLSLMGLIFTCLGVSWVIGQGNLAAAATRHTSALKQVATNSVSTRRVIVTPSHKLHVVITAYDENQKVDHHRYQYRLFRNGKRYGTISFSNGHTTKALKVKPGNYSVRVYDKKHQASFSGGISSSDQPHFI